MDLCSTLNAPRIVYLAGKVHFVKAMSLESTSIILAWLDDILPGKADRTFPPELGSDAAQAALNSAHGQVLLTWLALRGEGLSYDQCAALDTTELERVRLLQVLFATRRTAEPAPPGGTDVSQTWTGEGMAELAREIGLEAVGRLSRDQLEFLLSGGTADEQASPSANAYARACEMYDQAVAARALAAEAPC
jgi:hypothetical protein